MKIENNIYLNNFINFILMSSYQFYYSIVFRKKNYIYNKIISFTYRKKKNLDIFFFLHTFRIFDFILLNIILLTDEISNKQFLYVFYLFHFIYVSFVFVLILFD